MQDVGDHPEACSVVVILLLLHHVYFAEDHPPAIRSSHRPCCPCTGELDMDISEDLSFPMQDDNALRRYRCHNQAKHTTSISGGRLLRGEIVKQSLKVEGSNAVLAIFETLGSHASGLERWRELLAHFGSLCGLFKVFGRTFDGYRKTKLMGLLSQS